MLDHRLLDGRAVRDRILDSVAARVHVGAAKHTLGRLVSISIGEHKEVAVYVRGQASAAKKVRSSTPRIAINPGLHSQSGSTPANER